MKTADLMNISWAEKHLQYKVLPTKSLGKGRKWQEGAVRTVLLRSLWQRVSISFSTSITPPSPLNAFFLSFYSMVVFSHFCTFLCIKECLLSWLNHFKAKNLNRKFWDRKKKRTSKYNGYKFVQNCYKGIRIAKKKVQFKLISSFYCSILFSQKQQ